MTVKIDKNIPIPPPRSVLGKGYLSQYEWETMKVQDSFFIPCENIDHARRTQKHALVVGNQHQGKKKFTTRLSYDPPGVRVWRTK